MVKGRIMINIYKQPSNVTYYSGSAYQFSVLASSDLPEYTVRYEWSSSNDGTSWTVVADPTAATDNLKITPTNLAYGKTKYKVVIEELNPLGAVTSTVESDVASATVFDGRTSGKPTRARDGSKIRSRKSTDHEFIQTPVMDTLSVVGNIGNATLQDITKHVDFPTVQNAISDAAYVGRLNVNSIIINTDNTDPGGSPQLDTLVFSGLVSSPNAGDVAILDIFGRRVTVPDGSSATAVRDATLEMLLDFQTNDLYVRDVVPLGTDTINFAYRDMRDHTPEPWSQYGMTMNWSVGSPARYGYGYWNMFLSEDKTANDTSVVKLYYWKRIG